MTMLSIYAPSATAQLDELINPIEREPEALAFVAMLANAAAAGEVTAEGLTALQRMFTAAESPDTEAQADTRAELAQLGFDLGLLERFLPTSAANDSDDETEPDARKPGINAEGTVSGLAEKALRPLAKREVYQRGGELVHTPSDVTVDAAGVCSTGGALRIRKLPKQLLTNELNDCARWFTRIEKGDRTGEEQSCDVPSAVVTTIHDAGEWNHVRPLRGIASWPVMRSNCSIASREGYESDTHYILRNLPPVSLPMNPTQRDAQSAARELIRLVEEFPFQSDAARGAWLAGLMTLIARPAIKGPVPGLVIDAAAAGSGKTLLAQLIAWIVFGCKVDVSAVPRANDEEWNRRMHGIARKGAAYVVFDNAKGKIESSALEAALTGSGISDRTTGGGDEVSAPVVALFVFTLNQAQLSEDIVRRCLHIRLVSESERPATLGGFAISDLEGYAQKHRARLLRLVLTIFEAYRCAGKPHVNMRAMGSFETWRKVVCAPLMWAGCADPVDTQDGAYEAAADALSDIREFADAWTERFGTKALPIKQARAQLTDPPSIASARLDEVMHRLCDVPSDKPFTDKQLGQILKGFKDKALGGGRVITTDGHSGNYVKWCVRVKADRPVGERSESGESE